MINRDKTEKDLFLPQPGNIIAITSGFGSMGKTWLAVTLSHALNLERKSVLLFDADNGLLNTEFQLNLSYKYSLNDVISGNATLNQAAAPVNRKKFDVISASAGSGVLEDVPVGRLQVLQEELILLARNYDAVLIDLASSEKIINNLLPKQTNLILVCTNDPSNLVSTYNFLQNMAGSYQYKSLQIVVNYANSYEEGLRTYNTLRRACEQYSTAMPQLLGVIRRDTRVRDAIRNHAMLLNRYPMSEAAEDVSAIAGKLINREKTNVREF